MIEKIFNVIKFSFTEEIFGYINEAYICDIYTANGNPPNGAKC